MRVRDLSKNEQLRTDITAAATRIWLNRQVAYTPAEVARVKGMATLHVTKEYKRNVGIDGTLKLPVSIAVNSANFVVLEPATNPWCGVIESYSSCLLFKSQLWHNEHNTDTRQSLTIQYRTNTVFYCGSPLNKALPITANQTVSNRYGLCGFP